MCRSCRQPRCTEVAVLERRSVHGLCVGLSRKALTCQGALQLGRRCVKKDVGMEVLGCGKSLHPQEVQGMVSAQALP